MDYETIDKDMSSWIVSCTELTNRTRFYLNNDGTATDILSRAKRFRYYEQAMVAAIDARGEKAWAGFEWEAMSVPEAQWREMTS